MGLEDSTEPPKKKLKQAQLPFCNQQVKTNKRKLSNEVLGDVRPANKMICTTLGAKNDIIDKENKHVVIVVDSDSELTSEEICSPTSGEISQNLDIDAQGTSNQRENAKLIEVEVLSSEVLKSQSMANDPNKNFDNESKIKEQCDEVLTEKSDSVEIISCDVDDDPLIETKSDFAEDIKTSQKHNTSYSSEEETSDDLSDKINKTPTNSDQVSSNPETKLTPNTLEKLKLRESIRQEKLLQKEREKEARLKLKMEKEEKRRKHKEEKEEQRKKEKEEKERKRLAELKQKEDEKRLKEEEKKKKEEEKKKKEEERKLKEEERRKKEDAKEEERKKKEEARLLEQRKEDQAKKAFTNFFILKKTKTEVSGQPTAQEKPNFMPFPVKPDMRLAMEHRRSISDLEKVNLEAYVKENLVDEKLYLNNLRNGEYVPLKTESTWPLSEEQHDVIVIESIVDEESAGHSPEKKTKSKRKVRKAKLLQFHENRRPAYWGTWQKKSETVSRRRPFQKDVSFNYDVDSDSDWEDEGEGEDIADENDSDKEHSDEENISDVKDENGYILDNTFVPHGYLSDEEVQPDEEVFDREDYKLRMTTLKKEFEEEMKMKTERLKPRLLGCVWISNDTTAVSKGSLYEVLMKYRAVWDEEKGPIKVDGPLIEESPTVLGSSKAKPISPEVMKHLVKFIHGNHLSFIAMVLEFRTLMEKRNCPIPSKRALSLKIREIATKELDESGKHKWSVNKEICGEYGLTSPSQLDSSDMEKGNDTSVGNFIKRPSTSPQQQNVKQFILSPKIDQPVSDILPPPSTPVQAVKKRARLITLPHTPTNNATDIASVKSVHKDTPRPLHPFFKKVDSKHSADEGY